MAAGFLNETDLYRLYNITQNTLIRYPVDTIIASLREFFAKDSLYHYVDDPWGFPNVVDHTDLNTFAGLNDDSTTRVYIGRNNRFNAIYYPSILVKSGGVRHVPISINRNKYLVHYDTVKYVDGYGTEYLVQEPSAFVLSGAWDGSIVIDVLARGYRERDDLIELISVLFMDIAWDELFKAGISIKPNLNISAPNDTEDRNDKLFKQTITIEYRSEWRREIPVGNILEVINFCIDFVGDINNSESSAAPNLTINTTTQYLDALNELETSI